MKVVKSSIIEDSIQADKRRSVTELHVDDAGQEYRVNYLAEADAKIEDMLPFRAQQLEETAATEEEAAAARHLTEKERSAILLTLTDDQIAKIERIAPEKVAEVKDDWALQAAAADEEASTVKK